MNKTWIQEKIDENRYNQEIKRSGGIRMAKRGGFPGGMPGNMSNLMKQAQKMQRQMEETTKELEGKEYSASSGGGAVTVTVSGYRKK